MNPSSGVSFQKPSYEENKFKPHFQKLYYCQIKVLHILVTWHHRESQGDYGCEVFGDIYKKSEEAHV